jgi:hypothetical protein
MANEGIRQSSMPMAVPTRSISANGHDHCRAA